MTNKELIKRFFTGRIRYDEESYGFFIKPLLRESVGKFALYSKTSFLPMATVAPKNYFLISTLHPKHPTDNRNTHVALTTKIAKQLGVKFVASPQADRANFHKYMEEKINKNLSVLANDLRTGNYISVLRSAEVDPSEPKYAIISKPEPIYSVPESYQELMGNIYTLLEWESILELPKNQVALLDTDEVQSLWRWLIKENPDEKDRVLLTRLYTLSRLLAPHREEKKGGLITVWDPYPQSLSERK